MSSLTNYEGDPSEHIAIIGITGRFPGAKNIHEFWRNLRDGVESITFFTATELANSKKIDPSLLNNPRYVGADGIIDDMDLFDAEFFNISPTVAELMDPQHRLFLECAWELMELAGYDSESYRGRVAIYGSANLSTYLIRNIMSNPHLRETATSFQTLITNDKDFIATRASYKMNLTGPSMSVATLCSSSFVAIHLGCQTLLNYQCDMALAGAISLQVSHNEAFFYQEGGIGDPDGHCRAFDAKASGTVSGSGIGLIALKRLEDALADGDHIHAVIRGSALNNDGAIKYSYTAPSIEGQAEVIAEAISLAEVDPETIAYVETHGTGTRLGDPIEVSALTKAFRGNGATQNQYCAIGSVKTNIGHLVNAGGVASLIKTILAMQHGQIPASLNFEEPNPDIDFANSPFYVNSKLAEWRANGHPRRAGVSSFGIGGTNVHLIVEEAPELGTSGAARPWQLLVLSGRTETALAKQTANLVEYLKTNPQVNLADVAFTLQVGRRGFAYRRVLLCADVQDAISALSQTDTERSLTGVQETKGRPVAFMFPGQAEAEIIPGLTWELYQHEPIFREQLDACAEAIRPILQLDLRHILYPEMVKAQQPAQQLTQSTLTQAALFSIEYALARLWLAWGIKPQTILGYGVGEYVAACLADVFSLEDALGLATRQAQIGQDSLSQPQIPLISGLTGSQVTSKEALSPEYWRDLLSKPSDLNKGLELLLKETEQVLLEVGPGQDLQTWVTKHPHKTAHQVALSSLSLQRSDIASLLTCLGQLWLAGVQVDWYGFHTHEHRHRLPLPTYPFERKRYWIEPYQAESASLQTTTSAESPAKKQDMVDWFYLPVWKNTPLLRVRQFTETEGPWLILMDDQGIGARLSEDLRRAGQTVITVTTGETFAGNGADAYILDLDQPADYVALFKTLQETGKWPQRIIHLWSLEAEKSTSSDWRQFEQTQERGFYSLLFLAQTLAKSSATTELQIWVVSNHSQKVESVDRVYPEKVTLLGLSKVIPQENAQIACHYVDVALPEADISLNTLSRYLLAEIGSPSSGNVIAYRGARRWQQSFEPIRLPSVAEPLRPLRQKGVYLISGGLSDINLALAQYLAQTYQARLVIVEDKAFPHQDQWTQWLQGHDQQDRITQKIRHLQTLEAAGAEVMVLNINPTDPTQRQQNLAQIIARFGHPFGLIHAVGDIGDTTFRTILDISPLEGIRLFESKLQILLALEEMLAEQKLDFCLLVSSLASVLGGVGQAAYTAANLYLDAFVADRGTPWLSVNWDAWQFEADQSRIAALTPQLARFAISPTEGGLAFERILAAWVDDQVVVSTGDLESRIKHWLSSSSFLEIDQVEQKPQHPRPQLLTPYVAPTTDLEKALVNVWQESLGIEKIGVDDNFFDLGGDSLIAVKTITLLEKKLQAKVPTANLYQTPSVRALASLLDQDEEKVAEERAAQLDERRETLSRRNVYLRQKRKA